MKAAFEVIALPVSDPEKSWFCPMPEPQKK